MPPYIYLLDCVETDGLLVSLTTTIHLDFSRALSTKQYFKQNYLAAKQGSNLIVAQIAIVWEGKL